MVEQLWGLLRDSFVTFPPHFQQLPLHLSLSSESLLYDLFSVLLRRIFDGMPNLPNFLCVPVVFSVLIFFLPFYLFFLLNFLVYNLIKY